MTFHTFISSQFSLQTFLLSSVLMYSFLPSYLLPCTQLISILPWMTAPTSTLWSLLHIKVLLSPSGFINVLDCVKAKKNIFMTGIWGKASSNNYRWISISNYRTNRRKGMTPAADSICFLAHSYCRVRNRHFTQMRPNHGHLHWFESLQAKKGHQKKKTHRLLPGLLQFQSLPNFRCLHFQMACPTSPLWKKWLIIPFWTQTNKILFKRWHQFILLPAVLPTQNSGFSTATSWVQRGWGNAIFGHFQNPTGQSPKQTNLLLK